MPEMMPPPDALYRVLMQQAEQACLILDQAIIVDANGAADSLLGVPAGQLRGNLLTPFFPPQQADGSDSARAWQAHLQALQDGITAQFDWHFQRPGARLLHVRMRMSRAAGNLGGDGAQYILLSFQELADTHQIESELLAKRLEFQTLLDNFPGGVTMVDASLRFVAWNKEVLRLAGFTEELFRPEAPPSLIDVWRINIERNEYGTASTGETPEQQLEAWKERFNRREAHLFERTRPNGMVLEVRGVPMQNGGFVTTYQDITVQHQMKEQLRAQSLLLQEVLEHMSAGITVFDENLRLKVWNSGVMDMLDLPPAAFVQGATYESLLRIMLERGEYGEVDVEKELAWRMPVVRRFREHRYERTGPSGRTFLIHGKPLYNNGKVVEFITTLTEITDRKQSENALHEANARLEKLVAELNDARFELVRTEKLAALGSLVAGVAHELNTPLGNCLLMTSSIHDVAQQASDKVRAHSISRSELNAFFSRTIDAMNLLTRNLGNAAALVMRFKEVAITRGNAQRQRFELARQMNDVAVLMQEKISLAGHQLLLQVEPELMLDSYPGALEQVMVALINNSLMHGFEGRRGGSMRVLAERHGTAQAKITFRDDGAGIETHYLERIFDPFFTTKMGQGCSGLGLHICYNIVTALLGGEISAQSSAGQGTTLTLLLSLQAPINQ